MDDEQRNAEEEKNDTPESDQQTYEHHRIVVDPKQSPLRLDRFLQDRLFKVSRNKIQNAIRNGAVLVDGNEVKPNYLIRPREVITINLNQPPKEPGPVIPEDIPLDIHYEDEDLLVVFKPAGMVVHPGVGVHSGTLVNALAYHLQNQEIPVMKGNLANRPGLVHRIDKDTTGLLVIAKTEMAMTHLAKQFFDHTIERRYVALVWGEPEEDEGTIVGHIGRHRSLRTHMAVFPEGDEGKEATTHFKVLERLYYVSLIACQLETGRTHQIRVHLKYKGHPLFNDTKYGGDKIRKGTIYTKYKKFVENCFALLPRQALHAQSLGFVHPRSGEKMYFEAPLPDDFQAVLERWRSYLSSRKEHL
jgi:23S rRNA pseudouridine1911/1915/1917 synthase